MTDDEFLTAYGCYASHGWGIGICTRKDFTLVSFVSEDTNKQTVVNKKLWDTYKKSKKTFKKSKTDLNGKV